MKRCRTCLIPDTRPDTHFTDGVCSACIAYEARNSLDWEARKRDLIALLDRHDGRCIVPSSGGKDSHAQVLALLDLGADVTVVTATTCHLTPIGRANIDNLARFARTIEVTPNMSVRAKLNRISLELVGDISWGEHVSIHRVPFRVACDLKIPLVVYGECPTREYGGPPGSDETRRMTQRWVSEFGGFLGMRTSDFVGMEGITERDMRDYEAPTDAELERAGVEAHFLGQYIPWDSHANAERAKAAGMIQQLPTERNAWTHENLDNYQTLIHDYFCWLKFGYGRACAQVSVDIRAGRTTRGDGYLVTTERDGLFPHYYLDRDLEEILVPIGMRPPAFIELCNSFMNKPLFRNDAVVWGERMALRE